MYAETFVKHYLDLKQVPYEHHVHKTAYTAQETAEAEHVAGKMMAKTVVVKADNRFIMAVLPATVQVNEEMLRHAVGAQHLRLATERELEMLFADSEVGAMAPFGNLYGLPVYVEASLTQDPEIVFNAGTHQDTIRIRYKDFARLVQPTIYSFAKHVV